MIEDAMSTTLIVFVLIILLFGFDFTGQVRTQLALKDRPDPATTGQKPKLLKCRRLNS
jgi:hypothetical protein